MIILLLFLCIITIGYLLIKDYRSRRLLLINAQLKKKNEELESSNYAIEEQINKLEKYKSEMERTLSIKTQELGSLQDGIDRQQSVVDSLSDASQKMREEAARKIKELNQEHEQHIAQLDVLYMKKQKSLDEQYDQREKELQAKIQNNEQKLRDLEDKQDAYLQSLRREEEIKANQDYYRLVIDELDLNDIELLREIQKRMIRKEPVDKVIYEVYYRPAYDLLMSHLFTTKDKVCGIYKMTDLTTGLSYIGQSVDIRERWRQHIKTSLSYGKSSNKLYQTMQKSGQHNFTFEILEEVPRDKLNERESYWIEFFKTKDYGLNSTKGNS